MESSGRFGPFMAALSYAATCQMDHGEVPLILELRRFPDGAVLWFTIVEGREIRANSFRGLFESIPEMVSVAIPHQLTVTWNGRSREATIIERMFRDTEAPFDVSVQLQLVLDSEAYTTTACDVLQDAQMELYDIVRPEVQLVVQTCTTCFYGYGLSLGPGWDDRNDLRCHRDSPPQLFDSLRRKGKFASWDARYSGHYFVSAFHRCAAWREWREVEPLLGQGSSETTGR